VEGGKIGIRGEDTARNRGVQFLYRMHLNCDYLGHGTYGGKKNCGGGEESGLGLRLAEFLGLHKNGGGDLKPRMPLHLRQVPEGVEEGREEKKGCNKKANSESNHN